MNFVRRIINRIKNPRILNHLWINLRYRKLLDLKTEKFPFMVKDASVRFLLKKGSGSRIEINGKLRLNTWLGNNRKIFISLGKNATLKIHGEFGLGPGCRLLVCDGATLEIGGKEYEQNSGMSEECRIMAAKKIRIGKDLLCAWNVFITDSDWHPIEGAEMVKETVVGDRVWMTPNSSVLKGTVIGSGSILMNGTVASGQVFDERSLIGGLPGKRIRTAGVWHQS
jgi:acetyltransferase-like isoleucine patch superfamily enzyme